jgi:hypothetical protein
MIDPLTLLSEFVSAKRLLRRCREALAPLTSEEDLTPRHRATDLCEHIDLFLAKESVQRVPQRSWTGERVRMVDTCIRGPRDWPKGGQPRPSNTITGTAIGEPVFIEQHWLPVKWDDEEDPNWVKLSTVTRIASTLEMEGQTA